MLALEERARIAWKRVRGSAHAAAPAGSNSTGVIILAWLEKVTNRKPRDLAVALGSIGDGEYYGAMLASAIDDLVRASGVPEHGEH